ncbi:MAG: hypothetical protein R3E91_04690 [Chlamydiales bacterium]
MYQQTCQSHVRAYIGEESYYLWRFRDNGTKQEGLLNGIKIKIDYLKQECWYFGTEYLYAVGPLKGKTGKTHPLLSTLTDQIFEARFGYRLQQNTARSPFITPFVGWGYFKEINNFHPPSLLTWRFTDAFNFITVGFLSGTHFSSSLTMGIDFKVRFMENAKSKITNDPLYGETVLAIGDETLYLLEIPFTIMPSPLYKFSGQIVPLYGFRHFGEREGYPFNFKNTKFHLIGLQILLKHQF